MSAYMRITYHAGEGTIVSKRKSIYNNH